MADANQLLCLSLVRADSPDKVIEILQQSGYWDNESAWRDLGDTENNYSILGAQQSDPIAALVEKLVNSIDARLMGECLAAKIAPESAAAPASVRAAVAQFIEHSDPQKPENGKIEHWTPTQRTEQARRITLAATGPKGSPCISISDEGEGQTPERVPETFMSLAKSNKLRIPFVQGKFNMGGTGALRFCGGLHHLQLIVTKRNPAIYKSEGESLWSFTVVRRMQPTGGERSSVYRYLAPLKVMGADKGQVLRFNADTLPLRPQGNDAYVLPQRFGSFVKLYDYRYKGQSQILMKDGLLRQVDARLPSPALPIMMHECRSYSGNEGSFSNPATGLLVRLTDDKGDNLDSSFPKYDKMSVAGQEFKIGLFGFKQGRAATYLSKSEGVLFVVNGQSHGTLTSRFFTRSRVGLDYISDSLLVCVDCSALDGGSLEELFMNTRESLAESDLRREVEGHLEEFLRRHPTLREFNNRRREERLKEKAGADNTLTNTLEDVLSASPSLSAIFLAGQKLKSAFNVKAVTTSPDFKGKLFPSFFRFKHRAQGEELFRSAEYGRTVRVGFETDVEDNYFGRSKEPGTYAAEIETPEGWTSLPTHAFPLARGNATLSFDMPERIRLGDVISLRVTIQDEKNLEPFVNVAKIKVVPFKERENEGSKPPKPKPRGDSPGSEATTSGGLQPPNTVWVTKEEWGQYSFDERSALKIIPAGEGKKRSFDFYVNRDNIHLLNELKGSVGKEDLIYEQFKVGMVLLGLSVIHRLGSETEGETLNRSASEMASSAALVLIPMIRHLGTLELQAKPKLKEAA